MCMNSDGVMVLFRGLVFWRETYLILIHFRVPGFIAMANADATICLGIVKIVWIL